MAIKKRLIDADYLVTMIARNAKLSVTAFSEISRIIRNIETVDAVEVVRCEKCDYYDESGEYCKHWHGVRHPEHFCDDGERRTNES